MLSKISKKNTLLGIVLVCFIFLGSFFNLFSLSPIFIIFGSLVSIVFIMQPLDKIKEIPIILKVLFREKEYNYVNLMQKSSYWLDLYKKNEIINLEKAKNQLEDNFLKRGLTYVVDGLEEEKIKDLLRLELVSKKERHKKNIEFFKTVGNFIVTISILTTFLSVILILKEFGLTETLAKENKIPLALSITLLGLFLSKIILLPLSIKLKNLSSEEIKYLEIIQDIILSIKRREPNLILKRRVISMLSEKEKRKVEKHFQLFKNE